MSNNMYAGRDHPAIPGLTSPQEWNRLHRTPPSFPTPPASWPKPPGLDRDKERENEREQKERNNASRASPSVHRDSPRDRYTSATYLLDRAVVMMWNCRR